MRFEGLKFGAKVILAGAIICGAQSAIVSDAKGSDESFTISDDIDLPGGDYRSLKNTSLGNCEATCSSQERCKAFTYNQRARVCFLKERVSERVQFKNAVSGIKSAGFSGDKNDSQLETKEIIEEWHVANRRCRGGSGDNKETLAWCEVRSAITVVLELRNWCYGKEGEVGYQHEWHQCGANSYHAEIPRSVSSFGGVAPTSSAAAEFTFGTDEVKSTSHSQAFIKLGERITIEEITQRFSPYDVTTSNECDGFCVIIKNDDTSIQIFMDHDTNEVTSVRTWGQDVEDTNGNKYGSSLISANGTSQLKCAPGESLTCESNKIDGLNYIVDSRNNCKIRVDSGGKTEIPDCAKIGGFILWGY